MFDMKPLLMLYYVIWLFSYRMAEYKYIKNEKKSKKMRKKHEEYAVFPDGDETDCSSRTTFYDLCRHSSRSTSYSEQSSIDESLSKQSERKGRYDDNHDEVIRKLAVLPLSTVEEQNSRCSVTKMTKISAIDIQITSPEPRLMSTFVRPSCTTMIREDCTEPDSSDNDDGDKCKKPMTRARLNTDPIDPLSIRRSSPNTIKLPSIDVIAPSPTLSILSERLVIKEERSGSMLRPGITLSPISVRTLTPLSSMSSSSTMSDKFSFTSDSEDGLLGMRSRLLNRYNVLPPISRSASDDTKDDVFFQSSTGTNKSKVMIKSRKTKTRSTEEYTSNTCSGDSSLLYDRKRDSQRFAENMPRRNDTAAARRETLQKQKHTMKNFDSQSKDSPKRERNYHSSKGLGKQSRQQNLQSTRDGYKIETDRKPPTRKSTSGSRNSSGNKHLGSPKKTKLSKHDKLRRKSFVNKQREEYLVNFHRIHSTDSSGDSIFSKDSKQRGDSAASSKKGAKSISDSSDCQSARSEQTESSYL